MVIFLKEQEEVFIVVFGFKEAALEGHT